MPELQDGSDHTGPHRLSREGPRSETGDFRGRKVHSLRRSRRWGRTLAWGRGEPCALVPERLLQCPPVRGLHLGCLGPPTPLPSALTCSPLPPSALPRARRAPARAPARAGPSLDASFPPPRGSPNAACARKAPRAGGWHSLCHEARLSVAWGMSFFALCLLLHRPPLRTAAARGGPRLQWLRPHSLPLPAQSPAQAGEEPGLPSPAADLTGRLGKRCGPCR